MKTFWDFQEEQNESSADTEKPKQSKDERINAERQDLLNSISSDSVNRLRDRVAWILNQFPEARNSDVALQLKYWQTFESDIFDGHSITPADLYRLTRATSLVRERARIQNLYGLFAASPEVRKIRGTLSETEREKAIEDKPGYPYTVVYMDDSGKNGDYLLIGSLWFLVAGYQIKALSNEIRGLRESHKFHEEFHFKRMKPSDLATYIAFASIFLQNASVVSFKLISVPRSGTGNVQDAMEDLYYHLLLQGIKHEDITGRAALPRSLQVWKDAEEAGSDKLLLANLKDRLAQAAKSIHNDRLAIDQLYAVDSKHNPFLQVADLLASSANRVLNRSGEKHNHKDEFAEFLMWSIGIDMSMKPNNQMSDKAVYIAL